MRVVEEIRKRVGDRIAIAIEGHACWNLPAATRIARALEPYDILFLEEMVLPDGVSALKSLRQATTIPICGSERLFGRLEFYPVISAGAVEIVMPDLVWTGGITEFRKVAALADTFQLPIAPHNCGGPIATAANVHVAAHVPNLLRLELVRAFYHGFYDDLVIGTPVLRDGCLELPAGPGIGTRLRPELLKRPTTIVEESISTTSRGHWNEGEPWKNDLSDNF